MSADVKDSAGVRVWDLPTRLFHWLLVALIVLLYATGEYGLLDMRWHFWLGYAALALLMFRLLWGLFGSQTSRFTDFVRGPIAVGRYVKTQMSTNAHVSIGHNPLGGWSVLALLLSVLLQSVTGLFASDEIDTDGPLVGYVPGYTVKLMTRLHHWNENLLLLLIALHVGAVLFYLLVKHDNLIAPMVTGRKRGLEPRTLRFASTWLALALLILSATAVAALVLYAG
ncbi:MAG TPA: cytochrome b/b6 domain-containing protein [Rudaea sp.]|nr:cytochrome b/b6 domain-containing protein [Rudaea sp.]